MKKGSGKTAAAEKLRQAGEKLRSGETRAGKAARAFGAAAFGFLLGRLELPGGISPLGPGFVAACGASLPGAAAAAGTMVGAAAGFGLSGGLRTAAVSLLVYAALYLLQAWSLSRRVFFAPAAAACMAALIGGVYLYYGPRSAAAAVAWAAETALAGGSCVLFQAGLRRERTKGGMVGQAVLAMALVMALGAWRIAGRIAPAGAAAAFAVLAAACLGGSSAGGLCGLLLGFALDASAGTPGVSALSLGLAGALGGAAAGKGRLLIALGGVTGNALAVFWTAGFSRTGQLYELFIASVLFLLPSDRFFENLRPEPEAGGAGGLLRYMQGRAGLAASAFEELNALLRDTPEPRRADSDRFSVFDAAADEVCRGCAERDTCWGHNYETTRSALQAAFPAIEARGSAEAKDFPLWFRDHCVDVRGYTAAVSRALRELTRRRAQSRRLRADRGLLERQYADFAAVLRDLAAASRSPAREEPKLTRRMAAFLREHAPGTAADAYRDANGRLHIEITGVGRAGLLRRTDWLETLSRAAGTELSCPDPGGARLQLYEREPLEAEVGVAACGRGGKAPSGDVTRSFKTAEGVLYLIVADGMGSGSEAAADGSEAAALAEKLLRAGIGAETVLRILNTALLLRSEKRLGSLSLDLLSVNLFSGETCVYKYGAAPSYVRSGSQIRRVEGAAPSAGTEDVAPDCTRLQLESGSAAVILTDGAAQAENVGDKLLACAPGALRELAGSILTEAAARGGWEDDMTVLTLSLAKRGEPGIS